MKEHLSDSNTYVFLEGENELYYFDTSCPLKHIKHQVTQYPMSFSTSFLSTVSENKTRFTRKQIKGADKA